ncbi:hypothetical protein E1212_08510 [Jiangella ureilytica]|uniref:Uncharacterized protein n=1 Tax=Jiangella ureilytica TaxID=2530374 RepID=A0A4R4RRW4_9ACTN|nr:hypothetical protein [Jiangella ureilytica]TDC52620.1 hypothetical protein E1212_08510 [Jiangella ureilytica]
MPKHQPNEVVRRILLDSLMRKVEADLYPSSTMLDQIESLLTEDDIADYAAILVAHIDEDFYPSIPMIQRVLRLAA